MTERQAFRFAGVRIESIRNLSVVDVEASSHANYLFGFNGSGKTSFLEALYLLGYGRSFRSGSLDALTQRGSEFCRVVARVDAPSAQVTVGLERRSRSWSGRIDGAPVEQLSSLFVSVPVLCFDPASSMSFLSESESRRRFMDWGVFHVEPSLLPSWRRYNRALKQRNAALRLGDGSSAQAWVAQLAIEGERIDSARQRFMLGMQRCITDAVSLLAPALTGVELKLRSGWMAGISLEEFMLGNEARDLKLGFTAGGPHRADLQIEWDAKLFRDVASRGQAKALSLSLMIAQATWYHGLRGVWPVLLFDDVGSELDAIHQTRLREWISQSNAQTWLSGVDRDSPLLPAKGARFHVEQGKITRLI